MEYSITSPSGHGLHTWGWGMHQEQPQHTLSAPVRRTEHVDIIAAADLGVGDDDLYGVRVRGVGDGMRHDANRAHDLPGDGDLVWEVRGVTDDQRRFGYGAFVVLNTREFAVVAKLDLQILLVQHVCATVHGRKPRKALHASAALQGIRVRCQRMTGGWQSMVRDMEACCGIAAVNRRCAQSTWDNLSSSMQQSSASQLPRRGRHSGILFST